MRHVLSGSSRASRLLMLAAHFFRAGLMPITVLCVLLVATAVRPHDLGGARRPVALALGRWNAPDRLGVRRRTRRARAALRPLLAILGTVAAVTAVAALLLSGRTVRNPREFR